MLNGKVGVSVNMALALEDIGWGTAEHWMRMQASYELAQGAPGEGRRRTARGRAARMIRFRGQTPKWNCMPATPKLAELGRRRCHSAPMILPTRLR